jgi:hypothetical protein
MRREDLRSAIISIRVTHNEAFQEEASCTVRSGSSLSGRLLSRDSCKEIASNDSC